MTLYQGEGLWTLTQHEYSAHNIYLFITIPLSHGEKLTTIEQGVPTSATTDAALLCPAGGGGNKSEAWHAATASCI
jgi:hypothetical protein